MRVAGTPDTTLELRRMQVAKIGRELGGVEPWEVRREHLIEWLNSKDWAPQTRRSYRTTLRTFYRWALAFDHVEQDPTRGLPAVRVTQGAPRPAPADRIKAALATADERAHLMILLGATMGLRRGEIAAMHSDDIGDQFLTVHGKGNRSRLVPLQPDVAHALAPLRGTHRYVFTSGEDLHAHITPGVVGKLMSAQLGDGVTAHMLRHRFASAAYAGERDLRAVQTLLGHSKPETTAIYTQVPDGALAAAMDAAAL